MFCEVQHIAKSRNFSTPIFCLRAFSDVDNPAGHL